MVRQITCRNSTEQVSEVTAASAIVEAQGLARKLVEHERGACGGSTELAIYRASSLYGVDEYLAAKAERERALIKDVAESLERRGSPSAGIARKIAERAGQ